MQKNSVLEGAEIAHLSNIDGLGFKDQVVLEGAEIAHLSNFTLKE